MKPFISLARYKLYDYGYENYTYQILLRLLTPIESTGWNMFYG